MASILCYDGIGKRLGKTFDLFGKLSVALASNHRAHENVYSQKAAKEIDRNKD